MLVVRLQANATEETLLRLNQFEKELASLRTLLRKEALKVKGSNSSNNSDTNDSGISDASSCSSSSCLDLVDFSLRQQQMERLRFLAQHLQQSLEPTSKVRQT
jgi:hypothetical protein